MNAWSYASTPPYIFMVKGKVLPVIKHYAMNAYRGVDV
jgi:hypothetical protein